MEHFGFDHLDNQSQTLPSVRCDPVWLSGRIALLMGAYRKDEYQNAELFFAQVTQLLMQYEPEVVEWITSPTTGIQTKVKFPPALSEIKDACEDRVSVVATTRRYAAMGRYRAPRTRKPGPPPGQDYDTLFAKHGRPIGAFEEGREKPYGIKSND